LNALYRPVLKALTLELSTILSLMLVVASDAGYYMEHTHRTSASYWS